MDGAAPPAATAGAGPAAMQGQQPGQPPMGSSPVTGPTQNRGYEQAGKQSLGVAIKMLEKTVPLLGAASEAGRDVLQALTRLSKHIQPGEVSPAAEKNQLDNMRLRSAQGAQQMQQMRAAQGGGAGAGAGGAPPAAAAA